MQLLGFSVFMVNKTLPTKLIEFPTVFVPACNKKKHIGVTTGCKINGVLVTQNMSHGPANTGVTWEGFAFVFLIIELYLFNEKNTLFFEIILFTP